MSTTDDDPARHYVDAILGRAVDRVGGDVNGRTVVVGDPERTGSWAVAYPLGDTTIVWCTPETVERYAPLGADVATSGDGLIAAVERLGGTVDGAGHHRVLRRAPDVPPPAAATRPHRYLELDRDRTANRDLLATFIAACPDDDLDEAELDLDELDPAILVITDDDGAIAAYASARPWELAEAFDDIAVITRPDRRGEGLGAAVVAEFCRRRIARGRLMFYSCDVDNVGSNGVAEHVGFEIVCRVIAVELP